MLEIFVHYLHNQNYPNAYEERLSVFVNSFEKLMEIDMNPLKHFEFFELISLVTCEY